MRPGAGKKTVAEDKMSIAELLLFAVALSADAFAVSVCKGLSTGKTTLKESCICGAWFGGFQALMPLLGYLLGSTFARFITSVDHWVALVLLLLIGGNMIRESLSKEEESVNNSYGFISMLTMAVATSIDALAIGVAFAVEYENINIWLSVAVIGVTTFLLSATGVKVGSTVGARFGKKATFIGGAVLILIGLKIILEAYGLIKLPF